MCAACMDSSGEAHVYNAEEHWLGILADLLFQCSCIGLIYSKWSVRSTVSAVPGLV